MPPVNPAQAKTLAEIQTTLGNMKTTLSGIAANPTERARLEGTSLGKGITDVLGSAKNYVGTLENRGGVITSKSARNAVEQGKSVIGADSQSAFSKLMSDYSNLTKKFEQEKATRQNLEADASIAEKRRQQAVEEAVMQTKEKETPTGAGTSATGTTTDGATGQVAANTEPLAGLENDPVALALAQSMNEKVNLTNSQLTQLSDMFEDEDEDTKRTIRNAENLAKIQTERIQKENQRLAQAARVAGIVAGRGMYSPYEHEGIISEVVQEGLARVQEIEYTKQETIITAKKALRDFKYKTFTEATKLINDLSDMKRQTVIDMNARLVEIERMEREKINFDNEQADRNALLLAPELVNADQDTLVATAAANNIPLGALTKAIADYKYEQQSRELDLTAKSESIATSRYNRYLASVKAGEKDEEEIKPMDEKAVERFKASYGWTPPFGMSFEAALALNADFKDEPSAVKEARAKEIILGEFGDRAKTTTEDIKSLANEDEGVQNSLKQIGAQFGVGVTIGGKTFRSSVEKVTSRPEFNEYLTQVMAEEQATGVRLTTRQRIEAVAKAIEDDRLREEDRKATLQKNITKQNQPFQSANSTQAVIIK